MKLNWRAGDVRGRFNVSAFQTKYKGALQFFNVRPLAIPPTAPDQPTRTSIAINASDATVRGVEAEDRKSVVSGKSVSVRVDLGGRRSIKKKKKLHLRHIDSRLYHEQQNNQTNYVK